MKRYITMLICVASAVTMYAQSNLDLIGRFTGTHANDADLDVEALLDTIVNNGKPIYHDKDDFIGYTSLTQTHEPFNTVDLVYMPKRRTLTGENCVINQLIYTVGVGNIDRNEKSAVLDDDLTNFAQFSQVVAAGVGLNPYLSVKDNSCYYAAGTEAGFNITSSQTGLLQASVIEQCWIWFYRDGHVVDKKPVKQGSDGIGVSLIPIPGSDEASLCLTAVSDAIFDEVQLNFTQVLDLKVGGDLKVKYAFVGDARRRNVADITDMGNVVKVQSQSLYVYSDKSVEDLRNGSVSSFATVTGQQGIRVAFDNGIPGKEIFQPGDVIGFKVRTGSGSIASVASTTRLETFLKGDAYPTTGLINPKPDYFGNSIKNHTYTIDAKVAGLLEIGGTSDGVLSVTLTEPCSAFELDILTPVVLGGVGYIYLEVFYEPQPEIRHHCPIQPSMSKEICDLEVGYQLRSNPDIPVVWSVVSEPEENHGQATVSESGLVSGMMATGQYTFRATAADGCFDEVTITRGFDDGHASCTELLTNTSHYKEYRISTYESHDDPDWDITIAGTTGVQGAGNVIDWDETNYAVLPKALLSGLISTTPLLGVKKADGTNICDAGIYAGEYPNGVRVGFIVESKDVALGLNLLDHFHIRLYKNGQKVHNGTIKKSSTLSLGLIGNDHEMHKMQFAIDVPEGLIFDEIVLWKSGVANVALNETRIYSAFIEDAATDCSDPLVSCSTTLLSTEGTHTTINADYTGAWGVANVALVLKDLGEIVDDDPNSYAIYNKTVDVASSSYIAVNLGRTFDSTHDVGFILSNTAGLLDLNVADAILIKTYLNGVEQDSKNKWNVLGAEVIGNGDKQYMTLTTTQPYDEVRLIFGSGITAAVNMKIFGVYVIADYDEDGIPDCEDSNCCYKVTGDSNVCEGDVIQIDVQPSKTDVDMTGYKVVFYDDEDNPVAGEKISDETPDMRYTHIANNPGELYLIGFLEDGDDPDKVKIIGQYTVHPGFTIWKQDAENSDWNYWDNWSNGSPYCCTDVVIPTNAAVYPKLGVPVVDGDEYCCNNIHFEAFASVGATYKLNYNKAWVELQLQANKYNMLSAPLKWMYTGDMFIPASMNGVHTGDYFPTLDNTTSPQNRFNPIIYQRLWGNTAKGRLPGQSELVDLEVLTTNWSRNFNFLAYKYPVGEGFSLWVDNDRLAANTLFNFRFPKTHGVYAYFNDFDRSETDIAEDISRNADETGRFIYEYAKPADSSNIQFEYSKRILDSNDNIVSTTEHRNVYLDMPEITLSTESPTDCFLFGNPYMSPIDIFSFLKGNDNVESLSFYDGNTTSSAKLSTDKKSLLLTNETRKEIPPMTSVFLKVDGLKRTSLAVTLTADMVTGFSDDVAVPAALPQMRVSATDGIDNADMLIAGTSENELSNIMLFDNEVRPRLAIWGMNNNDICDIVPANDEIPLGIISDGNSDITLSFRANEDFNINDYMLVNVETGETHDLTAPLVIKHAGSSVGRWRLCNTKASSLQPLSIEKADVYLITNGNTVTACSKSGNISELRAYDVNGALVASESCNNAWEVSVSIPSGVYAIKVKTNASEQSYRILIR